MDTVGRIRREYFVGQRPIREISRALKVSRKVVRKAIRDPGAEFRYSRQSQPRPRLGGFVGRLEALLAENAKRPARERLTARRLHELLRGEGYAGAYDSVQRHARGWRRDHGKTEAVFIPLWFAPGEAYQFDWSHEVVVLGGVPAEVKVAHIPWAAWLADRLGLELRYVRKRPLGIGRNAQVEGGPVDGLRVLLVDDLATDAGSKVAFVRGLRTAGAAVSDTLVIFYHGVFPGSAERLAGLGLSLYALATWDDILRADAVDPMLDPADRAEIERFLPDPAHWSGLHGGRAAPMKPAL